MRVLKNILSQFHIYLLWLLLAALLWGWIFTFVTDTAPAKKVTVFIETDVCQDIALRLALEEDMPEGLRMIQVHPFSYAMFDENTLLDADIFIVSVSKAAEYRDSFLSAASLPAAESVSPDLPAGFRIYDASTGEGGARQYIGYVSPDAPAEDYYLFFGVKSLHAASLTGKGDDAALAVAEKLLQMN
jgi:hypothetical protein